MDRVNIKKVERLVNGILSTQGSQTAVIFSCQKNIKEEVDEN